MYMPAIILFYRLPRLVLQVCSPPSTGHRAPTFSTCTADSSLFTIQAGSTQGNPMQLQLSLILGSASLVKCKADPRSFSLIILHHA